jgi:hypothetical protein
MRQDEANPAFGATNALAAAKREMVAVSSALDRRAMVDAGVGTL